MDVGRATVTARLLGPDGTPRVGRISFQPLQDAWSQVVGSEKAAVIGATRADLDYEGRMPVLTLAAPATLPDGVNDYLVVVESPGDPLGPRHYRARILAGQTIDLTDLIAAAPYRVPGPGTPPIPSPAPQPGPGPSPQPPQPPQPQPPQRPLIRDAGGGLLAADADSGISPTPDGLLNWRND
jgi:hypothetical protein